MAGTDMSLPTGTRESTNSAGPESFRPYSMLLKPTVSVPSELNGNAEILRIGAGKGVRNQ